MKFVDLKNYKIVEKDNFYHMNLVINGEELLDMSVSKAQKQIDKLLKVGFVNKNVLYECRITGNIEVLDDFECVVDFITSAILKRNEQPMKVDEPRLGLPDEITKNVHCNYTPLKSAFDHVAYNDLINIHFITHDKQYQLYLVD